MLSDLLKFIKSQKNMPGQLGHRLVFCLHHNDEWNLNWLAFYEELPYQDKIVFSDLIENSIKLSKAKNYLGQECELVVFDARNEMNVDALGAVSGLIRGGGVLIVLLPEIEVWQNDTSLYKQYFESLLNSQRGVYYLENPDSLSMLKDYSVKDIPGTDRVESPYLTLEQKQAVENIYSDLAQAAPCCYVMSSGRGRGKTSSLGLVAAKLFADSDSSILVTAPKRSVSAPLFEQIGRLIPQAKKHESEVVSGHSQARFIAPDLLLETLPEADVLFVDEAAAIPVQMLDKFLQHYPSVVFSTTTHGYEGTGRGFVLKFQKILDQKRPGWKKIELHEPIRWAIGDPLEQWIEESLFLDVRLADVSSLTSNTQEYQVCQLDRKKLLEDAERRSSIFSLLVYAHYRTSPSDFKYLLDSNDVRLYALEKDNQVIGVLLISQEGGFDKALSTAIYRGERRPKGNLLAQTLCFHAGAENAAMLTYARVMRIAVHPELQSKGLGSYLLKCVIELEAGKVDVFGSSFSATPEVFRFWEKAGLKLMRMGFSRDHVSATHPAVVATGLTDAGSELVDQLHKKFARNYSIWRQGPLADLADEVSELIEIVELTGSDEAGSQDFDDVVSFARFNRNYEACLPAMTRWVKQNESLLVYLSGLQQKLIQECLANNSSWKQVANNCGLTGRAEAESALRESLLYMLKLYAEK